MMTMEIVRKEVNYRTELFAEIHLMSSVSRANGFRSDSCV